MDPISIIVMALATGAAAALKPATEQALKDAYTGLKGLIQRKFGHVDVAVLETDPTSKARQTVIKEDLEKTGAGQDEEVLRQAKALLDVIQTHAPDAPEAVGLKLHDVQAAAIEADTILAKGNAIGVDAQGVHAMGNISLKNITVQSGDDAPPKKAENRYPRNRV